MNLKKLRGKPRNRMQLMRLMQLLAPHLKMRRMFSGGQVPYDTDDSGMVDFQNSSDAFLDENSTLVGNIPMDSIDVSEPIYSVPVYQTKKEKRKESHQARRAARQNKRAFKRQLRDERQAAGMSKRGGMYRAQVKDYKQGQFAEEKEAAKAIKNWKYHD